MVRKIAIAVVAVAMLTVAGTLAIQHNNTVKAEQSAQAAKAATVAKNQAQAAKAKHDAQLAQVQKLVAECTKGANYWNSLPSVVRAKVTAPDCSLSVPIE